MNAGSPTQLNPGVSIVVPVYNSAATLPLLVERLHSVLESMGCRFEVILVNDGSRDESWRVVCQLAGQYPLVRGICLMRNYGQHNALLCGVRSAIFGVIFTLDDDLQHPPEEIPTLLQKLKEGYDVVYGTPENEPHVFWRTIASKMTKSALKNVMGADVARNVSAFRAFNTQLRDAFAGYQSPFISLDVVLTWGTTRFAAVAVRHDPRKAGKSNYSFIALVRHALTLMTGFSIWPLELASLVGFVFLIFGVCILLYVIICYFLQGGSVPGFPFLASIIAIFSGAQMFALGVIGEYLARMHYRMMERPVYVIAQEYGQRLNESR